MEQGSLRERVLARSVLKHITKQNNKFNLGAAVGQDFAEMCYDGGASVLKNGNCCSELPPVVIADGMSGTPYIAWVKAMNNFACSGGAVRGVRLMLLLPPDAEEAQIKRYMAEFYSLADADAVQIAGGQTQIDEACTAPCFFVTALGVQGLYRQNVGAVTPGMDIVMTKQAGLMGTDILAREKAAELETRFSGGYIQGARRCREEYSVMPEALVVSEYLRESSAAEHGWSSGAAFRVYYMHDVSHGGLYGALWQLSVRLNRGICIRHGDIPIRQETVEICEFFNINPYMLEGTGSLLLVTDNGGAAVEELARRGMEAAVIGKVAANQDKVLSMRYDERRYLSPVSGDEIYKVISRI